VPELVADGDDYRLEEPANDAMRTVPAVATYDSRGDLSVDPLELSRPGYRLADRSLSEEAYSTMVAQLQDAWRGDASLSAKEGAQTPKGIWPRGGVPPSTGVRAGDLCTLNGDPGVYEEGDDGLLYCRPHRVGPTRADSAVSVPRTMTADQAKGVRDQAYFEYCERLVNEWRS
jgi:hypothetical protein